MKLTVLQVGSLAREVALVLARFSRASVVSYGLALLIFAEHSHMTEVSAVTAGLTDADPGGFPSSSRLAQAFSHVRGRRPERE